MASINPHDVRNAIRAAKAVARKYIVVTWDTTGLHLTTDTRDAREDVGALAVTTNLSGIEVPSGHPLMCYIRARDLDSLMDAVGDAESVGVTVDDRGRLCIVSGGVSGGVSVALVDADVDNDVRETRVRLPRGDGDLVAGVGPDGIRAMVRASAAASAAKSVGTRRDLEYVFLSRFGGRTVALATDGFRMAIVPTSIGNHSGDDGIICAVPLSVVRALSRMTLDPSCGAYIYRGTHETQQSMTVGSTRWSWESNANPLQWVDRLVELAFAGESAHRFGVSLAFRQSVKLAAWETEHGQSGRSTALTHEGDVVMYEAQAPLDTLIRIDPRKLAAAIDEVDGVLIRVNGELDPVVVFGATGRALVMPGRR